MLELELLFCFITLDTVEAGQVDFETASKRVITNAIADCLLPTSRAKMAEWF